MVALPYITKSNNYLHIGKQHPELPLEGEKDGGGGGGGSAVKLPFKIF